MQRRPQTIEHVVEAPHHSRTRRTPLDFAKQRSNAYEADNDDETEGIDSNRRIRSIKGYEPPRSRRQRPPAAVRGQVGMSGSGNATEKHYADEFAENGNGSFSDQAKTAAISTFRRGGRVAVDQGHRSNNSSRSRIDGSGMRPSQESDSYTSGPNNSHGRQTASSNNNITHSKSVSSSRTGSKSNRISTASSISSSAESRLKQPPVLMPIVPIDYANHPVKAALWMTLQLREVFHLKQQPAELLNFILFERHEAITKRQYCLKEAAFVLACDPFKRGKALEQRLWHEILYPSIQVLKSAIVSSISTMDRQRNQDWSLAELLEAYELTIVDAQQFYIRVLAGAFDLYSNKSSLLCLNQLDICASLSTQTTGDPSGALVGSVTPQHSSLSAVKKDELLRDIMHRCLIFLGDLSRYWCLLYPTEWYLPQLYYAVAHHLNVNSGRPFNQLGKACADASNSLNATYFYVRAIGTALDGSSGSGADKNLRSFLKHALASYSGVSDKDGVVYIAKTNKSAYLQEMWINIQLVLYAVMFCGENTSAASSATAADGVKKSVVAPPLPSASFFKRACESIVENFSHSFAHSISAHTNAATNSGSQKQGRKISTGTNKNSNENAANVSAGNLFELDAEHVWKLLIIVIECIEQAAKRLVNCTTASAVGGAGDAGKATPPSSGNSAEVWIEVIAHIYSLVFALFERVCDAVDQQLTAIAPQVEKLYRALDFAVSSNSNVLRLLPLSKQSTTSLPNLHYFLTTENVFSDSEVEPEENYTRLKKHSGRSASGGVGHQRRRRMHASDSEEEYPALPGGAVNQQKGSPASKERSVKYPPAYHQLMQTNGWTFDKAIASLYSDEADDSGTSPAEQVMSMTDFLPYQLRIEDDDDQQSPTPAKTGDNNRKSPRSPTKFDNSSPVQLVLRQWRDFSNFELPEPPPDQFSLDAVDFSGGSKKAGGPLQQDQDQHEQLWLYIVNKLAQLLDGIEYLPCVRLFGAWLLSKPENVEVCHHNYARMLELLASMGTATAMPRSVLKGLMQIIEPSKFANSQENFGFENDAKQQRALVMADESHLLGFGAFSFLDRLAGVEQQPAAKSGVVAGVASVEVVDLATRPAYQIVGLYRLNQYCEHLHRVESVFDEVTRLHDSVRNKTDRPMYRVREPGSTEVDRALQLAVAQSAAAEQERKRVTMQKMATLWMQDVQRKVDDELAEEMRQHYERDRPDIPVYLVFDTSCFLGYLPVVENLLKTQMFHCIVPFVVIDELDMLKQSSKAARDAVRFIDSEQNRQQQAIAASAAAGAEQPTALFKLQAWSETLSGSGGKTDDAVWKQNHHPHETSLNNDAKQQRSIQFVSDIAECCEYFYAEASSRLNEGGGRGDERELLTLLTAHDDAVSAYAVLYRRQMQSMETGGLNVPVEHILKLHERMNMPYNPKWKTDRLALLS